MAYFDEFKSARTEQMARVSRDSAVARVLDEHKISNRVIGRLMDAAAALALEQFMALVRMELKVIDLNEELKHEAMTMRPVDIARFLHEFSNRTEEQG